MKHIKVFEDFKLESINERKNTFKIDNIEIINIGSDITFTDGNNNVSFKQDRIDDVIEALKNLKR